MPSEEKHTDQTQQRNNQILIRDIIKYSVASKKGQEELKKQQGYPSSLDFLLRLLVARTALQIMEKICHISINDIFSSFLIYLNKK